MSSKPPSCLIILTGLPKSNKSLVAKDILRRLLDAGEECVLVDEPSLSLKRNKAYKDARMEKNYSSDVAIDGGKVCETKRTARHFRLYEFS